MEAHSAEADWRSALCSDITGWASKEPGPGLWPQCPHVGDFFPVSPSVSLRCWRALWESFSLTPASCFLELTAPRWLWEGRVARRRRACWERAVGQEMSRHTHTHTNMMRNNCFSVSIAGKGHQQESVKGNAPKVKTVSWRHRSQQLYFSSLPLSVQEGTSGQTL